MTQKERNKAGTYKDVSDRFLKKKFHCNECKYSCEMDEEFVDNITTHSENSFIPPPRHWLCRKCPKCQHECRLGFVEWGHLLTIINYNKVIALIPPDFPET